MDLQKEQYATDDSDVEPDIEEVITDQYDDFFKLIVNQFRDVCGINIDTNSGEFNAENVKYIYDMFIYKFRNALFKQNSRSKCLDYTTLLKYFFCICTNAVRFNYLFKQTTYRYWVWFTIYKREPIFYAFDTLIS